MVCAKATKSVCTTASGLRRKLSQFMRDLIMEERREHSVGRTYVSLCCGRRFHWACRSLIASILRARACPTHRLAYLCRLPISSHGPCESYDYGLGKDNKKFSLRSIEVPKGYLSLNASVSNRVLLSPSDLFLDCPDISRVSMREEVPRERMDAWRPRRNPQ